LIVNNYYTLFVVESFTLQCYFREVVILKTGHITIGRLMFNARVCINLYRVAPKVSHYEESSLNRTKNRQLR